MNAQNTNEKGNIERRTWGVSFSEVNITNEKGGIIAKPLSKTTEQKDTHAVVKGVIMIRNLQAGTPFGYLAVLPLTDNQQLPFWPQALQLFFN